jgi:hypothetical protein
MTNDMRREIVLRELSQGALAGLPSEVSAQAADLVLAALDRYDTWAMGHTAGPEAHPPSTRWRVEILDGGEWIADSRTYTARSLATDRYESENRQAPAWADGKPVERRLVRETTTYTVETPDTRPAP